MLSSLFTYFRLFLFSIPEDIVHFNYPIRTKVLDSKLGTRAFWVSDVHNRITISLTSGFPNTYRMLRMERVLYFGHISFMEFLTDYDFQMDEKLKSILQSQNFRTKLFAIYNYGNRFKGISTSYPSFQEKMVLSSLLNFQYSSFVRPQFSPK